MSFAGNSMQPRSWGRYPAGATILSAIPTRERSAAFARPDARSFAPTRRGRCGSSRRRPGSAAWTGERRLPLGRQLACPALRAPSHAPESRAPDPGGEGASRASCTPGACRPHARGWPGRALAPRLASELVVHWSISRATRPQLPAIGRGTRAAIPWEGVGRERCQGRGLESRGRGSRRRVSRP